MEVSGQFYVLADLHQGKERRYPLDRKMGGSQSRSGHSGGEEKNSLIYI